MPSDSQTVLKLGTRGSLLARAQSRLVADQLQQAHPQLQIEFTIFRTSGDQITERPLHKFGGKGLFTKELEQALLDGAIDFAVHSLKDVPVTMPLVEQAGLVVGAVPAREDPREVLVSFRAPRLRDLPPRARVGTGSFRRRSQLLAMRSDFCVESIRGNIDTRLRKLQAGQFDALLLACAGLRRAGLFDESFMYPLDPAELLPAPGQGALALQCRRGDDRTRGLLAVLHDPITAACIEAERELVRLLNGDCHSPIAALVDADGGTLRLRAVVGGRDGRPPVIRADVTGLFSDPHATARLAFDALTREGVETLLHGGQ